MVIYRYTNLDTTKNEIRLLRLLPGSFNDPIKIQIYTTPLTVPSSESDMRMSLDELNKTVPKPWGAYKTVHGRYIFDNHESDQTSWMHPDPSFDSSALGTTFEDPPANYEPKYEALSYTWGSAESPEQAFVETPEDGYAGTRDAVTLPIGRNLASALRHLRYTQTSRTMWVDAICINQGSIPERNVQVKRMADIYRLADRVVIWLGQHENDSDLAMNMLNHLGAQVVLLENDWRSRAPEATEPDWYRLGKPMPIAEHVWAAMNHLLKRRWFDRVWVMQEGQLANSRAIVTCGATSIPWPRMQAALADLSSITDVSHEMLERFTRLEHFAFRQTGRSLYSLIFRNVYRACADPRDKIYGILGLAHPTIAARITPNYSASVEDAYKDVFLSYSTYSHRADMLCACDLGFRKIDGPSWIPDWTAIPESSVRISSLMSHDVSAACMEYVPPDVLRIIGVHCAVVHDVGAAASSEPANVIEAMRQWEPENLQTSSYVTGESMLDAFVSIIRGNCIKERFPDYGFPTMQSWKETYLSKISRSQGSGDLEDTMKDSPVDTQPGKQKAWDEAKEC
ncbi:hypothetical protein N0V90_001171 [Kalmusia sp. IMI 367209]|nr:hypothetical protein N0V90_001171 [Kalmusia sp. IMI 367209]